MNDAVEEEEDHNDPHMMEDEALEGSDPIWEGNDEENIDTPENHSNNDFCSTDTVFLETRNQINDATRHHGSYQEAWDKIKSLEGNEVPTKHKKRGKVNWTVVKSDEITTDIFWGSFRRDAEY